MPVTFRATVIQTGPGFVKVKLQGGDNRRLSNPEFAAHLKRGAEIDVTPDHDNRYRYVPAASGAATVSTKRAAGPASISARAASTRPANPLAHLRPGQVLHRVKTVEPDGKQTVLEYIALAKDPKAPPRMEESRVVKRGVAAPARTGSATAATTPVEAIEVEYVSGQARLGAVECNLFRAADGTEYYSPKTKAYHNKDKVEIVPLGVVRTSRGNVNLGESKERFDSMDKTVARARARMTRDYRLEFLPEETAKLAPAAPAPAAAAGPAAPVASATASLNLYCASTPQYFSGRFGAAYLHRMELVGTDEVLLVPEHFRLTRGRTVACTPIGIIKTFDGDRRICVPTDTLRAGDRIEEVRLWMASRLTINIDPLPTPVPTPPAAPAATSISLICADPWASYLSGSSGGGYFIKMTDPSSRRSFYIPESFAPLQGPTLPCTLIGSIRTFDGVRTVCIPTERIAYYGGTVERAREALSRNMDITIDPLAPA